MNQELEQSPSSGNVFEDFGRLMESLCTSRPRYKIDMGGFSGSGKPLLACGSGTSKR